MIDAVGGQLLTQSSEFPGWKRRKVRTSYEEKNKATVNVQNDVWNTESSHAARDDGEELQLTRISLLSSQERGQKRTVPSKLVA